MPQPKDKDWLNGYKNKTPIYAVYKRPTSKQGTLMRWMKLEPIIQSEVSQKDKDHYNILTHIYGI